MSPQWKKKLNVVHFTEYVPCPYCSELCGSNLALARHVLREHNWNKDFLKDFEIVEQNGWVMILKQKDENVT